MHNLANQNYWKIRPKPTNYKITDSKLTYFLIDCFYYSSSNFELFFKVLPKFIRTGDRLLEVGSGPGRNLVLLSKLLGADVHGVENCPSRYEVNKKYFKYSGLQTANLKKENIFTYKPEKKFDVIISVGFIEHFNDPQKVVEIQRRLLRKGGKIICIIPNFSGINFLIQKLISTNNLEKHNLEIMNIRAFDNLFKGFDKEYMGYYGIFSGGILKTENIIYASIGKLLKIIKPFFNLIFIIYAIFFSTSKISTGPFLIYIGSKK
jgi:SAM-dependent methyltransferase